MIYTLHQALLLWNCFLHSPLKTVWYGICFSHNPNLSILFWIVVVIIIVFCSHVLVLCLSSWSIGKALSIEVGHMLWLWKIASSQFSSTWKLVLLPPRKFQCPLFMEYATNIGPDNQLTSITLVWLRKVIHKHFDLIMVIHSLSWLRFLHPHLYLDIKNIFSLMNKCYINNKASRGCKAYMDIKSIFLHINLWDEVYMKKLLKGKLLVFHDGSGYIFYGLNQSSWSTDW